MSSSSTPSPPLTVGIDMGSCWTKVVLGPTASCEIVRNEVGGHATPTAVSFSSTGGRHVGATAQQKNALHKLNRLLEVQGNQEEEEEDVFLSSSNSSFTRNDQGEIVVQDYPKAGETQAFTPAAIIAMLLGNVRKNVLAALDRLSLMPATGDENDQNIRYALSIPPNMSHASQQALLDAAHAAGLGSTTYLVETTHCLCRSFQCKFPEYMDGRTVMFVDMADTQTTVSLLQMGSKKSNDEGTKDAESKDTKESSYRVLACKRNSSLGAHSVDVRLWHHFQSTVKALSDITSQSSRSGQRLLEACGKMKQTLSQLTEAHTTVAHQDADVKLSLTRAQLAELCAKDAQALHDLLQSVLEQPEEGQSKISVVDHVEILGGGVRIPWVKDAIRGVLSAPDQELRTSFDETACALGGALLLADKADNDVDNDSIGNLFVTFDTSEESKKRREALKAAEEEMAKQDDDFQAISDLKNKLESHILEMRAAQHAKHGSLLPTEGFQSYLDELDDWLFSEQADQISKTDMEAKLQSTISKTKELCAQYFEAVEQENQAKDKEMEEEAKKAQLERAGQEDEDDADHDTRRLPKKRRMEIVMKNKAEANELFSDGNFKFAAARYTKALAHCSKFIDLSPDDTKEVNGIKLSLNLNLALAYTKLENHDQALRVCNDALALDGESVKALYRRASVYYEKKKWDLADKDIKKAASFAPEDKAVKKLQDRITAQIKRQMEKEKKMAQKMFG